MNPNLERYIEYVTNDIFSKLKFKWDEVINTHYVIYPMNRTWSIPQLRHNGWIISDSFSEDSAWVTYLSHNYGVHPTESKLIWDRILKLLEKKFPHYWR